MLNFFGVDPGSTTGWAVVNVDSATTPQKPLQELDIATGQMSGEEYQQSHDLFRLIKNCQPCAVVIEDFIPRFLNQARHFLSPVRITNQLTMLMWDAKLPWLLQMPSMAKSTIPDEYLQAHDLYSPGMPHANDALRHCLTLLRRCEAKPGLYAQLTKPIGLDAVTPD